MSVEVLERAFEEAIERGLLRSGAEVDTGAAAGVREAPPPYGETSPGGYRRRGPEDYDRAPILIDFRRHRDDPAAAPLPAVAARRSQAEIRVR